MLYKRYILATNKAANKYFLLLLFMFTFFFGRSFAQELLIIPGGDGNSTITICQGQSVTLNSVNSKFVPELGTWFVNPASCSAITTNTVTLPAYIDVGSITVAPTVTTTYYAQRFLEGHVSERYCDFVIIEVIPSASGTIYAFPSVIVPPTTSTLIGSDLSAFSGYTWHWYSDVACTMPIGTGPTKTVSPSGTTVYYARAENGVCLGAVQQVTVGVLTSHGDNVTLYSDKTFVCTIGQKVELTVNSNYTDLSNLIYYSTGCGGIHNNSTQIAANRDSYTVTPSANTTYSVIDYGVTPPHCSEIYVSFSPEPVVATGILANPSTISPGETTTLTLYASLLDPNLQWEWYTQNCAITDPVATPIGFGTSLEVSPTVTTTYYVRSGYISAQGCSPDGPCISVVVVVDQPFVPITLIASNVNTCSGTQVTLTADGGDDNLYSWSTASGNFGGIGNSVNVSPTQTTTYYVSGTVNGVYSQASAVIYVTPQAPTPNSITISPLPVYVGQGVTLTVSGPALPANMQWQWYNQECSADPVASIIGVGSTLLATPTVITTYYVRSTFITSSSCSPGACTSVVVEPFLPLILETSHNIICSGSVITLTANGGDNNEYTWSPLPSITSISGNLAFAAPTQTTTYYVTGTVAGTPAQGLVVVEVNQIPSGTITATTACTSTFVNFAGSSVVADATYAWDFGDGTSSVVQNTNHTYGAPGRYWVSLTITKGLCQYVCSLYVKAGSPEAYFDNAPVCVGAAMVPTNVSAGATSYLWKFGDGSTSSASNPVHVYTTAGTYIVTLTVNYEGCIKQIEKAVVVSPQVSNASLALSTQELCIGASLLVTATSTNATVFTWNFGDGGTATGQNASHIYTSSPANGFYTVTLTATNGGCSRTAQSYVTIKSPPAIAIVGPAEVCAGSTTNLRSVINNMASPTSQYGYTWSYSATGDDNTFTAIAAADGGTFFQIQTGTAGFYRVQVTDNCGAPATSLIHTLTVRQLPEGSVVATQGVTCAGRNDGDATVTVTSPTSGATILWSQSGETSLAAIHLPQGNNQVQISNGLCVKTLDVNIGYNGPQIEVATTNTNCVEPPTIFGTANTTATGGSSPYSYLYKNMAGAVLGSSQSLGTLSNGIYQVEVTDNTSCKVTSAFSITSPIVNVNVSSEQSCSGTGDGSATATPGISLPEGTTPTFTYNWVNLTNTAVSIGTTAAIGSLAAGDYEVTVTDGTYGCSGTGTVSITATPAIVADITTTNPKCKGSADGNLLANVSGGVAPYSYSWLKGTTGVSKGQEVLNADEGTYALTVTDANNCALTVNATITAPASLTVSLSDQTIPCQLQATGTGGSLTPADYVYTWLRIADEKPTTFTSAQVATVTVGGATSTAADMPLGQYKVMLTDKNGCVAYSEIKSTLPRPATTYTVYYAWVRPVEEPEVPEVFKNEEIADVVEEMTNDLASQLSKCLELQAGIFDNQQTTSCLGGSNFKDQVLVSYEMPYYHYTLYYYDRAGRLTKTVPPQGVDILDETEVAQVQGYRGGTVTTLPTQLHSLSTSYGYNSLSQLITQTTPDGGTSNFVYNDIAQLRFSRNAKQAAENNYSYTKYDYLSRIVEVGQHAGPFTGLSANNMDFPLTDNQQITRTSYSVPANIDYYGESQRYLLNRVSQSYYDEDGQDNTLKDRTHTFYSYDPHGNVQWLVQNIGGFVQNGMEYSYDLISNKVLQVSYNKNRNDRLFHKYSYDADNRITKVFTSRNGVTWDRDAAYNYFAHGPLKRMEIGQDNVQGIDYTYTIEGWLKAINTAALDKTLDPGKDGKTLADAAQDVFGMSLGYYRGDFHRKIGTTGAYTYSSLNTGNNISSAQHDLYNGNIASWAHNTNVAFTFEPNKVLGETFFYDQLNRLESSSMSTKNAADVLFTATTALATSYTYDGNGNILTLNRRDNIPSVMDMDELGYTYKPNTNQLISVNDASNSTTANAFYGTHQYSYDPSGNLVSETAVEQTASGAKTINNVINWNVYGKISSVVRSVGSTNPQTLTFSYDAQGNRVKKEVTTGSTPDKTTSTYYVRDAQGNIMGVYEQNNVYDAGEASYTANYRVKEQPIYGSDRLGQYSYPDAPTSGSDPFLIATAAITDGAAGNIDLLNNGTFERAGLGHWISPAVSSYTLLGSANNACDCRIKRAEFTGSPKTLNAQANQVNFMGEAGNAIAVGENLQGDLQFYSVTAANYLGNAAVNLVYDKTGQLMKNSDAIKSDPQSKPVIVKAAGSNAQYYLFTVNNGTPYAHTIDMAQQGYGNSSTTLLGEVVQKNTAVDATGTYGLHFTGLEDALTGKNYVYTTRYVAAANPADAGTTEIIAFELDATGISTPIVLASLPGRDATGNGELTLSDDGKQLLYYHKGKKVGGFNHRETQIVTLPFIGDSRKTIDAANIYTVMDNGAGTYGKGSIDQIAGSAYINQKGIYKSTISASPLVISEENVFAIGEGTSTRALQNNTLGTAVQFGDVRRGLDGKIYVAGKSNTTGLTQLGATSLLASLNPSGEPTNYGLTGYLPTQVFKVGATETGFVTGREIGLKLYELVDHLDNVTAVVSDILMPHDNDNNNVLDVLTAKIESANDYLPFGAIMFGRNFSSNAYRYGMNSKEKDDDVLGSGIMYDYGLRFYDVRLAKFLSVDPLGNKFPFYSPYQYAGNSPIQFIDLDGGEPQIPMFEKIKYGDNVALNSVKAIPNAATGIVNGGIGLINIGLYNAYMYATLGPSGYSKAVGNYWKNTELPAAKQTLNNTVSYFSETTMKQMGKDIMNKVSSPEFFEATLALGGSMLLGGPKGGLGAEMSMPVKNVAINFERFESGTTFASAEGQQLGWYTNSVEKGLELELNIPSKLQNQGLGSKIFEDAMKSNPNKFTATWVESDMYSTGSSVNLERYNNALKTMSPEKAAFNTWSGRQAAKHGFNNVTIKNLPNGIEATFTK